MKNLTHFDGQPYLPLNDAAELCGVTPEDLRELCAEGMLWGREIAGILYVSKNSIDNYKWDRVQPRKKEKKAQHSPKAVPHVRVPPKEFMDLRPRKKAKPRKKAQPRLENAVLTGAVAAVAFLTYVAVTPVTLMEIAALVSKEAAAAAAAAAQLLQ